MKRTRFIPNLCSKLGYVVLPGLRYPLPRYLYYFKHAVVIKKHSKRFPTEM